MKRRDFIKQSAAITGGLTLTGIGSSIIASCATSETFKISLAEWSLHRSLQSGDIDHLDFYSIAKNEFGISAVEYVNSFFFDKAKNVSYLKEMKTRADDLGVKSLLIMCDNEGNLGDPDSNKRTQAIENHFKWVEAAQYLGCHSIRVNARSFGTYDEQIELATDGLRRLTEFGDTLDINTIVEEHGGLSSKKAAQNLLDADVVIPGFRRSNKPVEALLNKYIPSVTILGSVILGLIAGVSDILGVFGSGIGILLTVDILINYYNQLVREKVELVMPRLGAWLGR